MTDQSSAPIRVTVWGENRHEQIEEHVAKIYPQGMHTTIAEGIAENLGDGCVVRTATLDDRITRLLEAATMKEFLGRFFEPICPARSDFSASATAIHSRRTPLRAAACWITSTARPAGPPRSPVMT